MPEYIVNKIKDKKDYNEVHKQGGLFLPGTKNRGPLEIFNDAIQAVEYIQSTGYNADGCYHCCPRAHYG